MSSLRIRLARAEEAELICAIEASAAEAFRGSAHAEVADHPPPPSSAYAALTAAGLVLMAERDDWAVGFAAYEVIPDALHLKELAVRYERQRQGIGRALVEAVAAEARRRSLPAVTLTTFRDISWNAPWYASLGFAELGPEALGEHLRGELAAGAGRGLTGRCAMHLLV